MIRRTAPFAALACALLLVTPAAAGTFYVGAELGESSTDAVDESAIDDGSFGSINVDDSDSSWKAFVGYRFLKFVAVEVAAVDLGQFEVSGTSSGGGVFPAGNVSATAAADGYTVSALGVLPVGPGFKVFARAGYFIWDVDFDLTSSGVGTTVNDSQDGEDLVYGAGLAYKFAMGLGVRLEYEQYEVEDESIDVISAGLTWRF